MPGNKNERQIYLLQLLLLAYVDAHSHLRFPSPVLSQKAAQGSGPDPRATAQADICE